MKIPQYSGEVSLYRSTRRYSSVRRIRSRPAVIPAQLQEIDLPFSTGGGSIRMARRGAFGHGSTCSWAHFRPPHAATLDSRQRHWRPRPARHPAISNGLRSLGVS